MFLNSINHFRAISIVIIVIGHVYVMKQHAGENIIDGIFTNMILGGTSLFVFISGFLFYVVFYRRYNFLNFISSKARNLIVPYTLLSIVPIYFDMKSNHLLWKHFVPENNEFIDYYIIPTLKFYITGNFLVAYWYIPFIFLTFMISPLHFMFIKLRNNVQVSIIIFLFMISLLMHRPVDNINIFQSVLYFSPVYLFGIWCAIHRSKIYTSFEGKEIYLITAVFCLAVIQTLLGDIGNYHKDMFIYDGIDLMLIQKIMLCLFFMVWLHRFEDHRNIVLDTLAETSFAIFFLHGYAILVIERLQPMLAVPSDLQSFYYLFLVIPVIVACTVSAVMAKRIFNGSSRYLIGY